MTSSEDLLKYYLVDFDNVSDIEENEGVDFFKIESWSGLIICTENWIKLVECSFDENQLKTYFETLNEEHRKQYFTFALACFVNFVQGNFTGPELPKYVQDFLKTNLFDEFDFYKLLSVNNEDVNVNTKFPALLVASKAIFKCCHFIPIVNIWWQWRSVFVHQQILEELSPALLSNADRLQKELQNVSLEGILKAKFEIEQAQLYLLYRNVTKVETNIETASNILGVKYELQGKLGKRTKYQEKDIAQLALEITLIENENMPRPLVKEFNIPKNLPLKDDVRLNEVKYADKTREMLLPNAEQKLLLTAIQEIIIAKPQDDLFYEEIQPFFSLILNQNNTWPVRTTALLLRSKMESRHKRTVERSLQQCDEVINCIKNEKPHPLNRMGIFGTGLKPIWKTEAQYAGALVTLGLLKESLNIYLRLQLWEEVIFCYSALNLRHKAAEVIKRQLDINPTVKLWCLLGDATDDVSCYEKAWELSKRRSSRAQHHWGRYLFNCKQYQQCIPHFEKSVSINPLQINVWFNLGYAALETENWQVAATAYRRYTTLEPGSFEAWNNLAKAYIKLGNKRSAYQALIDALRCNYENWKVWDNLMVVSADIAHYGDIIRAYHRILDLKEKHLDLDVLGNLVYGVCNNINDSEGRPAGRFMQKTRELLGRVTALYPGEGHLWELYASVAPVMQLRAQRLHRAYRGYAQSGWEKDPVRCQQVLYVCHKLAEVALHEHIDTCDTLINSVKLTLNSAISVIKKQNYEETSSLLTEVSNLLDEVIKKAHQSKT